MFALGEVLLVVRGPIAARLQSKGVARLLEGEPLYKREAEEAVAKAANEPEGGDDLTATEEGEQSGAVAAVEEELLRPDTLEAKEIGVEEAGMPAALPEQEQAAETVPVEEVAHLEAATATESDGL